MNQLGLLVSAGMQPLSHSFELIAATLDIVKMKMKLTNLK